MRCEKQEENGRGKKDNKWGSRQTKPGGGAQKKRKPAARCSVVTFCLKRVQERKTFPQNKKLRSDDSGDTCAVTILFSVVGGSTRNVSGRGGNNVEYLLSRA